MSAREELLIVAGELRGSLAVLAKINAYYDEFESQGESTGRTTERAIVLSDIFSNFYTCAETAFLRISQFFENSLDSERWHKDLLSKMTVVIKGVRERVISDESRMSLSEMLRFRHFKRYYFEFDYDWDRLELVRKKYLDVRGRLQAELEAYVAYLESHADAAGGS